MGLLFAGGLKTKFTGRNIFRERAGDVGCWGCCGGGDVYGWGFYWRKKVLALRRTKRLLITPSGLNIKNPFCSSFFPRIAGKKIRGGCTGFDRDL